VEPIRPIGPAQDGPAPIPAIRRLTPKEREDAARERQRKRRAKEHGAQGPGSGVPPRPGGSLDVRA
jgi:hypothetical protein